MIHYYAYAVIAREADGKTVRPLYDGPDLRTAKIIAEDFHEKSGKQVVVKQLGGGVSFYLAAQRTADQTV